MCCLKPRTQVKIPVRVRLKQFPSEITDCSDVPVRYEVIARDEPGTVYGCEVNFQREEHGRTESLHKLAGEKPTSQVSGERKVGNGKQFVDHAVKRTV